MTGPQKSTSSRLKRMLALQQEVDTADGGGGYQKAWTTIANLWAEITPIIGGDGTVDRGGGKKYYFGGQVQSEITHRILLRYMDGVTAGMRLMYENRIFSIRFVADTQENHETLTIFAQEGVAT